MKSKTLVAFSTILTLVGASAFAQDEGAAPSAAQDGPRFRGGISVGGGFEQVGALKGPFGGVDGRLGVQLNNLLGLYVQPHLSFGTFGGLLGISGTLSTAAMAELTLFDRLFVGAGFGYGVLNNPSGPMFQARVGGYPLMGKADNGIRRKGLMLGVDLRTIFTAVGTGILVIGSIGYEAF